MITPWLTPIANQQRLLMVSLTDQNRQLVAVFEASWEPGRPRWRVGVTQVQGYRVCDEVRHSALWEELRRSGRPLLDPFTIEDSAWSAELTGRLKSWREAWSAVRAGVHRDSIAPPDEAVRPAAVARGSTSRSRRRRRSPCYRLLLSPALTSSSWRGEIGERADRQKSTPGAAPCFTFAIPGHGAPPERTEAVPYTCTPRSTRT